jgi:uncharacterized protein YdeI (YjbR/CyaY-like superfamily)
MRDTGHRDPRVDAYIEASADFARPILTRLREIVHAACPQAKETIKWGAPYFEHEGPMCGMVAFKRHCAFVFWKDRLIVENPSDEAMGQLGRIEELADLPPKKTLTAWVRKAARLNEEGVKVPRRARRARPPVKVPADLQKALNRNARAKDAFEAFSSSHRREYVDWIEEAKREETRRKRVASAIEWMAEGKPRHWKYR